MPININQTQKSSQDGKQGKETVQKFKSFTLNSFIMKIILKKNLEPDFWKSSVAVLLAVGKNIPDLTPGSPAGGDYSPLVITAHSSLTPAEAGS